MQAKYLFSHALVNVGDKTEQVGDVIVLTRKTDLFQHKDMAQVCNISPSWGGFANRLREVEGIHLYGESVSCRVGTDEHSVNELMKPHIFAADWFKYSYQMNGGTYTIFMGTEKGHVPNNQFTGIEWIPCEFKDIRSTMKEEEEAHHGW